MAGTYNCYLNTLGYEPLTKTMNKLQNLQKTLSESEDVSIPYFVQGVEMQFTQETLDQWVDDEVGLDVYTGYLFNRNGRPTIQIRRNKPLKDSLKNPSKDELKKLEKDASDEWRFAAQELIDMLNNDKPDADEFYLQSVSGDGFTITT